MSTPTTFPAPCITSSPNSESEKLSRPFSHDQRTSCIHLDTTGHILQTCSLPRRCPLPQYLKDKVQSVAAPRGEGQNGVVGVYVQNLVVLSGVFPGQGVQEGRREARRALVVELVGCSGWESQSVDLCECQTCPSADQDQCIPLRRSRRSHAFGRKFAKTIGNKKKPKKTCIAGGDGGKSYLSSPDAFQSRCKTEP